MPILLLLLYLVLCLVVAILGRHTRIGYWGTALVALFITPLITLVLLTLFRDRFYAAAR